MDLYLEASTSMIDVMPDHIYAKLQNGETSFISWGKCTFYTENEKCFGTCENVSIDMMPADDKFNLLQGMQIVEIGLSVKEDKKGKRIVNIESEDEAFLITNMDFYDRKGRLSIKPSFVNDKVLYCVKVYISPDGEFSFKEMEFKPFPDEHERYYFEDRDTAAQALIRSFHNLTANVYSSDHPEVEEWLRMMDERIEMMCKKFHTFTFWKESCTDSAIGYALVEVKHRKLSNGGFTLVEQTADMDFDFSMFPDEDYRWDRIMDPDGGVLTREDVFGF